MSKRFTKGMVLMVAALVVACIALSVSLRENRQLGAKIATLQDKAAEHERMVDHQQQLLAQARLGSTLLYRMALRGEYDEVFQVMQTIPAESLSCWTLELPEYPSIRLITFHHYRENPDGSRLPIDECKSAAMIVQAQSLDVVDYVVHRGFTSLSKSSVAPFYVWCGDLADGTQIKYPILPTGFQRNEP